MAAPFGRHLTRNLVSLAIALGVASVMFAAHLIEEIYKIDILGVIEVKLVDQRFRFRQERKPSGEVVIAAIDSRSVEELGRWPWPRTYQAQLMDRLREWKAKTVAFDVLFTEPQGADEARRLRQIAAALSPPRPYSPEVAAARTALDGALAEVEQDRLFAAALGRTFNDDAALPVLGFDFVFSEYLRNVTQLGRVMAPAEEQLVLDLASYMSRDENLPILRSEPPKLALAVRPLVSQLAQQSASLGFVNPIYDQDGALRRYLMLVVYSSAVRQAFERKHSVATALADPEARVQAYLPLAMAAVATHLRLTVDQLVLDLAKGQIRFPVPQGKRTVERVWHFDRFDGTSAVDYHGPAQTFPTYSFIDILHDQLRGPDGKPISGPRAFAGKLVFVGMTDPGNADFFITPFTSRLPGVEQHANVAENLIHGHELRTHSDYTVAVGLSAVAAAVVAALLAANLGSFMAGLSVTLLTVGFLRYTFLDFARDGLIWNWTVPVLTVVFSFATVTAYRSSLERRGKREMQARSRFIQETFGRYLSGEVVEMLVGSPEGLELGGARRRLTIMMSDLRGFTAMSERTGPEVVVGVLNYYLGAMTEIIFKHGGTIDEFIGDAILALFGAPIERPDDARRAVACAIEMQRAMPAINQHLRERDLPEVEMGIALHTGEVVVGNIGSERRTKYGVVGTTVNTTGRLESCSVGGQVYVSEETLADAGEKVEVGASIEIRAKGLAKPLHAFELVSIGEPYNLSMPQVEERLVDLAAPVRMVFEVMEGKLSDGTTVTGELLRLSKIGGDLRCDPRPELLANLKLSIQPADGPPVEGDIYAKVIDRPAAEGCCAIRFTSLPPAAKSYFKQLLP